MGRFLKIHDNDNVVIALENFHKSETVNIDGKTFKIREEIPSGHKMAVENIAGGQDILKYGMSIGYATRDIKAGQYVHSHNLKSNRK